MNKKEQQAQFAIGTYKGPRYTVRYKDNTPSKYRYRKEAGYVVSTMEFNLNAWAAESAITKVIRENVYVVEAVRPYLIATRADEGLG